MKKTLAMMLALIMVLAAAPAISFADAAAEPTTVTIATTWQCPDYFGETNENKLLLEKENIILQPVFCDTEKLGLMLASGDLTDIVISEYTYLSTIMTNNMAKNLDEIMDEHIPNLNNDIYKTGNDLLRLQMSGGTGNLYFFVPGRGVEYAGSNDRNVRGYTVRWDLYKKIGMPEIKNDDDYVDVIGKMVEAAGGVTKDGSTLYGMGLNGTTLGDWYVRGRYVAEAGTRPTFEGFLYEASVKDGTLINGYTDLEHSPFWVDMRFYNKLYNAGLLDPDSFTMTASELGEKVKAGAYAASRTRDNGLYNVNVLEDVNTLEGYVMIPSEGAIMHADFLTPCGFAPGDYSFISAATENWEAAAKVVNFYHDPDVSRLIYSGIQGVHWDFDENGEPVIKDEVLKLSNELGYGSEAFFEQTGIWGGYWELTPCVSTATHPDGHFMSLFEEQKYRAQALNNMDKDYAQTYGFETPSAYHTSLIDSGKITTLVGERGLLVTMGITDIPLDVQRVMTNCNDILFQYIAELVTAADTEEFNAVVENCLADIEAAGEADAWKWCSEAYAKSFEVVNPIFEELQAEYLAHPAGRP